jgi:hypothetical protein
MFLFVFGLINYAQVLIGGIQMKAAKWLAVIVIHEDTAIANSIPHSYPGRFDYFSKNGFDD